MKIVEMFTCIKVEWQVKLTSEEAFFHTTNLMIHVTRIFSSFDRCILHSSSGCLGCCWLWKKCQYTWSSLWLPEGPQWVRRVMRGHDAQTDEGPYVCVLLFYCHHCQGSFIIWSKNGINSCCLTQSIYISFWLWTNVLETQVTIL